MAPPRVLIVPGSARSQALSKRLAVAALAAIDRAAGAGTLIDLALFEMPLYHADLEAREGVPEATRRLQALIAEHEALLIASPEYNGSMTPLLVNTLDWCSRVARANPTGSGLAVFGDQQPDVAFRIALAQQSPAGDLKTLAHAGRNDDPGLAHAGKLGVHQQVRQLVAAAIEGLHPAQQNRIEDRPGQSFGHLDRQLRAGRQCALDPFRLDPSRHGRGRRRRWVAGAEAAGSH